MPDDLLTTVKAALALDTGCLCGLPQCAECRAWSPLVENRNILRALLARCEAAEDERDAARAEAARMRDARADDVALVARLSHQVVALRDAITRVLDGPHYIDRDYQDVLLAALDTPEREGGDK